MATEKRSFWLGAAAALATALVFSSALGFGFLTADDTAHVSANPILRGSLSSLWVSRYQVPGLYMPTTYTVWWAAAKAGPTLNPVFFHALNWIFHALNVFLAFQCFRRAGLSPGAAFFGATLFGLHPIQVETAAWITAFKDVFAGTFVLLTVWLALEDRWAAASAAFLLALLSKPVAAVTPAIVVVFLWAARFPVKRRLPLLAGWLVLSAAMLGWTKVLQPGPEFPWWVRIRVAADALAFSLSKTAFPVGLGLNYGRTPAYVLAHGVGLAVAVILVAAVFLWYRRRDRHLIAGAALFILPWLPVSGVVSFFHQIHSTTADRFLYLSLLGAGLAAGPFLESRKVFAPALIAALALLSALQLTHWRSEAALYGRMAQINPSAENHYRHAMALNREGRTGEATAALKLALALNPSDPRYANNLALLHAEQGRTGEAENELRKALSLSPESTTLKANLETLVRRRLSKAGP